MRKMGISLIHLVFSDPLELKSIEVVSQAINLFSLVFFN